MRQVDPGINWIWYHTTTKEEAKEWFKELTGKEATDYDIVDPVVRTPAGKNDDKYGFRLHK
jgi:hypothetical protein